MPGKRLHAFVLMPFDEELDWVYEDLIKPAFELAGFETLRADNIDSQQNILKDIVAEIAESDVVVADLTESNPNVYYELGLAHALRKQVILMSQDVGMAPFDLRSSKTVGEYAEWMTAHRHQLPSWFPVDNAREALAASYPFHPSVLSVFERKWQALPRFQQTRGILRLLALWVSHDGMDSSRYHHRGHDEPAPEAIAKEESRCSIRPSPLTSQSRSFKSPFRTRPVGSMPSID